MIVSADDVADEMLPYAIPALHQSFPLLAHLLTRKIITRMIIVAVELAVGFTAPWVIPLLPLIDMFLQWVSDEKMSPDQKEKLRQTAALYRTVHARMSAPVCFALANPEPVISAED